MASESAPTGSRSPADAARGALLGLAAGELQGGGGSATDMALVIARSIAATGTYSAEEAVRGYIDLLRSEAGLMGRITRRSLERMAGGETGYEATRATHEEFDGKTAGNGPLARVAPFGIAFARDHDG